MPIITCTHCGATRNTPAHKLPRKPTRARCPECRQSFLFEPAAQRPAEQTLVISCPHCGLPREIPQGRSTDPRATVSCRRCKQSFRLGRQNGPAAATPQLGKPGYLFAASWELFCRRGWGLLGIYLCGGLLLFAPLLFGTFYLAQLTASRVLFWSALAGTAAYLFLGGSWMTASLFNHICHQRLGFFSAIGRGGRQLWKFSALLLLVGLVIAGGSLLLIIPGLIFTVWFFFGNFVLAEEGGGILQAMAKSRQLVAGHWWAVFGRFSLLLLAVMAITTLTGRLPVIGGPVNFAFALLLTPFSLIYAYLIYQDLKKCQPQRKSTSPQTPWLPLSCALVGWLLIPGLLFVMSTSKSLQRPELSLLDSQLMSQFLGPELPSELLSPEPLSKNLYQWPEKLTLADYDRLLENSPRDTPRGLVLGPATLSAEHFWSDEQSPHLWLKLEIRDAPNLALSTNRSTRILIDKVLDTQQQDRYNRGHSFENAAFHWINMSHRNSDDRAFAGIRNVYLTAGTRPEQIRSISGLLEFNLPIGVETLKIKAQDVGRTIQVAGKRLKIEALKNNGISLIFSGKRAELLSVRASNENAEYLPGAGFTWQKQGPKLKLQQMFSGDVDSVTILVAQESIARRYPFEITR